MNVEENLFESIYVDIINYCLEYNSKITEFSFLFGPERFVHIKGGSSIKYHLMRATAPPEYHTNITSDLDIFLVCDDDEKDIHIEEFIKGLIELFDHHTITHTIENGLVKIAFNGVNIVDLTTFTELYEELDPESSMFFYACETLGKTEKQYFRELESIKTEDYSSLEKKTFTSVEFEYYSSQKGLSIYMGYLDKIPSWQSNYLAYLERASNMSLSEGERRQARMFAGRYHYQLSEEYIGKLQKKVTRYQKKLELLKMLLERK